MRVAYTRRRLLLLDPQSALVTFGDIRVIGLAPYARSHLRVARQ